MAQKGEAMLVNFQLTGVMPLLMHADDIEAADMLDAWRRDPKRKNESKAGDDRSPPWTWHTYLYSDGTHITIPSQNLMVCLRYAGTQLSLKGQKTFKQLSQSGMLVVNEYLDFRVKGKQIPIAAIAALRESPFPDQCKAVQKMGFRLFVKRARIGQAKHVRVRPRFEEWTASGQISVSAKEITSERLEQMFEIGGRAGLCDWRPNCRTPGPYGMFAASLAVVEK